MNHYDYAHNLARSLKESEEYQAMLKAKEKMEADPKNKEMLREYRKFQWEMQKAQALQEEIDEVTKRRMAQLGDLVAANSAIQDYLMAEYRFGQVMMDIQKILSDSLAEWFKIAAESIVDEEETPQ
ncbi:MAG: YlbF family regulator [Syntrophaceticus sp.]|nr:YlbF family regulator [Syntrophaceticus sp.]MDD3314613.1 YlbF family regulator [Syntrophaceticus sp.]MDD4360356.1 YlbF family regulator [Syntrophaceticus sp.]MDD4783597.1 YlbF family regulator [Syntrophaceticus sp.]